MLTACNRGIFYGIIQFFDNGYIREVMQRSALPNRQLIISGTETGNRKQKDLITEEALKEASVYFKKGDTEHGYDYGSGQNDRSG
jgi:hypothetical protein